MIYEADFVWHGHIIFNYRDINMALTSFENSVYSKHLGDPLLPPLPQQTMQRSVKALLHKDFCHGTFHI
jgi:hypothetical protein